MKTAWSGRRPLIGLTGRRKKGRDIAGNLDSLADADIDMYYVDYTRAVLNAGGVPVLLPLDVDPAEVIDHLDGVLLSGGTDIDPVRYGQEPEPGLYPAESERDDFEFELLDRVAERELPTLGICRGLQVVNVHAGGTLHQHIDGHADPEQPVHVELHEVVFEPESALGELYGHKRSVNSIHHQTVDSLGGDLRVTARSGDGDVEGIEHQDLPIVAVQWHPEMMLAASEDPIFRWLVEAASSRSNT